MTLVWDLLQLRQVRDSSLDHSASNNVIESHFVTILQNVMTNNNRIMSDHKTNVSRWNVSVIWCHYLLKCHLLFLVIAINPFWIFIPSFNFGISSPVSRHQPHKEQHVECGNLMCTGEICTAPPQSVFAVFCRLVSSWFPGNFSKPLIRSIWRAHKSNTWR
jgi:hypothetical protein